MQIELEKDTVEKVNKASKLLGVDKKELIGKAILVYVNNVNKYGEFKKEMIEWDTLSDEALTHFENSL